MYVIERKKHLVIMTVVIAMLFSIIIPTTKNSVHAEDPVALTVYYGDQIAKTYTMRELTSAAINIEGNQKYNYSTYNTYATFSKVNNVSGITIEHLISNAGITISAIDSNHLISVVSGEDDNTASFTKNQLLNESRYYYPNGEKGTLNGSKGNVASREGKSLVTAIISFEPRENRLLFGQKEPNEQTQKDWNKYITTGNGGKIIITTKPALQLDEVVIKPESKALLWGSNVNLSHVQSGLKDVDAKIYYSIDGKSPTMASDIYNYITWGGTVNNKITTPEGSSIFTVSAIATKYGWLDSTPVAISYPTLPNTVVGVKATPTTYNSATITWTGKKNTDGYNIYRSTSKNNGFVKIVSQKGPTSTKYIDKNIKTGSTYFYKVTTYKGALESAYSQTTSVKTSLKKPKGLKAKAKGKKKIIVTAPKVAGQSGYKVYRSTKKNKGFKAIKTVKTTKSLKYTDKKVKSKKKYYYKIKVYRVVDKQKVYSVFSARVARKAK